MKQRAFIASCMLATLLLGVLPSCTSEFEFDKLSTDDLSGQWAFPLINSTVTIEDLLSDTSSSVTEGENGLITLVYKTDDMISMDGQARTSIPDQEKTLIENFDLPDLPENMAGEIPLSFDFVFELLDEDHRIDTMYLKNGMYTIGLRTNLNKDDATIDLVVSNFRHLETGEPLTASFDLSNPGGEEILMSMEVDLSDYFVQFDNEVQQNTVFIDGLVQFEGDDNPNVSPYYFDLINGFSGMEFSKFIGFIAENEESYADSIEINIFNSTDYSSVAFGPGSVRMNIDVYNSLGLPITLELNKFTGYNTVNSKDSIELTLDPSIIEINYPPMENFNEYAHTAINTEFVDINNMLDISPDILFLSFTGHINRDMPPETVNYFADNSNLLLEANIEVDLFAGISAFQVADTLEFDPATLENVNLMEFMVEIENGFPINASVQIRFTDAQYTVLGDLFEDETNLIDAGIAGPGPDYRITSPTTRKSLVLLDREKLDLIRDAEKILFTAVLSTDGSQFVKIYSDYSMHLNLGAKVVYTY